MNASSSLFAGSLHYPSAHIQILLNLLLSPALPQLQDTGILPSRSTSHHRPCREEANIHKDLHQL